MREHGWRWYVFGAQAVVAHGRPRLTADVDASVDLAGAEPGALVDALAEHGFALRYPLSAEHLSGARLLPMVHTPSGMPLDLTIAGPGLDQEFVARARPFDLGGVEVPVISAEDLVAMKVLAGRRKDLEDVRGVLVEQEQRLDLERVRDVLAAMEAVTGENTLLPKLERLLRKRRR
jgi:predicted nucleotidyltransferase